MILPLLSVSSKGFLDLLLFPCCLHYRYLYFDCLFSGFCFHPDLYFLDLCEIDALALHDLYLIELD